jgi:hypothetical protein
LEYRRRPCLQQRRHGRQRFRRRHSRDCHRYRRLRPTIYAELLSNYGHTSLGPKKYTTSAFIASALGRLSRHGEIELLGGRPATGFWSYNQSVGYWALPPRPPEGQVLT